MAKTKEELDQLKQECESLVSKLKELTDDELKQVTGGVGVDLHVTGLKKVALMVGTFAKVDVNQNI